MIRSRQRAGLVFLAVILLGLAVGASSAFASGGCCAGMPAGHGSGDPAAPCHSVAPTSCCEPAASGTAATSQGAPAFAGVVHDPYAGFSAKATRATAPLRARAREPGLSTIVLRL